MHDQDCLPQGFEWRLQDRADSSILAHERISKEGERILVVTNFTPVPQTHYRIGVPHQGQYQLLLNTDDEKYHGSHFTVAEMLESEAISSEGLSQSVALTLPPLSTLFYKLKVS